MSKQLARRFPRLQRLHMTLSLSVALHDLEPLTPLAARGCKLSLAIELDPAKQPARQSHQLSRLLPQLISLPRLDCLTISAHELSGAQKLALAGHKGLRRLVLQLDKPATARKSHFRDVEQFVVSQRPRASRQT